MYQAVYRKGLPAHIQEYDRGVATLQRTNSRYYNEEGPDREPDELKGRRAELAALKAENPRASRPPGSYSSAWRALHREVDACELAGQTHPRAEAVYRLVQRPPGEVKAEREARRARSIITFRAQRVAETEGSARHHARTCPHLVFHPKRQACDRLEGGNIWGENDEQYEERCQKAAEAGRQELEEEAKKYPLLSLPTTLNLSKIGPGANYFG